MKYIIKGWEPQSFTEWKALANDDWKPTYDDLSGSVKKDVKNSLIDEQGGICCYCESKLLYDDSHIEHLDSQTNHEEKRLDYNNMLCSCQKQLKKGEPRHCGNSKEDAPLPITPLMSECEKKFKYLADGTIEGVYKDEQQTIEILQLDIEKLKNLRKSAIEPFIIDPLTFEAISQDEAKVFAEAYLQPSNGKYNEFYTTIKYLFS